uniref:SCP domain-containing protein n=1 Tax=Sphenodon punctatus TaxID=8508 RepID=A0A8D0GKA4_SPHPU
MNISQLLSVLDLLALSICCYCYEQNALPGIEDTLFTEECVRVHNNFRSKVYPPASNMRHMTWDPALAKTARAWAKKCHFDHNVYLKVQGKVHPDFTPVGENIWTGSLSLFTVTAAIRSWYDEVRHYSFETHACTKVCGHYTQVVWATSYKVGCAVQFCRKVSGFDSLSNGAHFICNYGPAGNNGRQPYKKGSACNDCRGDQCVNKLCENSTREKWLSDWDTFVHGTKSPAPVPPHSSCDQYCITVVVLRPLFVLLTLGAVYMVQKQYPQIFIYEFVQHVTVFGFSLKT